jgi:2,4-dienoyl-CoA reductase (NADPH2)
MSAPAAGSDEERVLLSPLEVGPIRLRNRVVLSAMTTGFGYADGAPDASLSAYLRARTRDVGMGVVAFGAVTAEARVEQQIPWMWRPDAAEVLAPLVRALKEGGGHACLQLGHGGRQTSETVTGLAPVAPSAVAPPAFSKVTPRALSFDEVEEIVAAFGHAARAAAAAGFDAIELHGGHGYLVHQFLNPLANRRDDRYGGATLAQRARFGEEVVRAIRAGAHDLALIVRINGSDLMPGGLTVDDAAGAARAFIAAGAHAVAVSAGVYGSVPYTIPMLDDEETPFLQAASYVRARVEAPVIAVGGVARPVVAEAALRRGDCDAVAVGRALLADPDWVAKAAAGRDADIRPCIATVDACAGMLATGGAISCTVNPEVGREARAASPLRARGLRIVVVGAGPAGLEAACHAAEIGHDVVLVERSAPLGGALRLAALTPPLRRLSRLLSWYERRLAAAGVDVRAGTEADRATIASLAPDVLVVATGARTEPPVLDGYDVLPTWTIEDLLAGGRSTCDTAAGPGSAVVFGSGRVALAGVLACAAAGMAATLLTRDRPGGDATSLVRRGYLARLDRQGVARVRGRPVALEAGGVRFTDGERAGLLAADALVLADRRVPERPASLDGLANATIRVGDARRPRDLTAAIHEGREAIDALEPGRVPTGQEAAS